MAEEALIVLAYIDEAGARGRVRDLTEDRDHEFGLMSALVFEPSAHAEAINLFTPGFEAFRQARPAGAKLHITDAFIAGNEAWAVVANQVREDFLQIILRTHPRVIYAARRLRLSRLWHEHTRDVTAQAKAAKRSEIKIVGGDHPSDWRIDDELIQSLALRLDAFAAMPSEKVGLKQVDLLFDETDAEVAKRYESALKRTSSISMNVEKVPGWDPKSQSRVEGSIKFEVKDAPFPIDTAYLGGVHVVGKEHPLILAADIVANHLCHHLGKLGPNSPLNTPASISGWRLEERVWGVSDNASEDLY